MARLVSQTLIRDSQTLTRDSQTLIRIIQRPRPPQLICIRLRSCRPKAGRVAELDLGTESDSRTVELEVLTLKRLEDAIQSFVIKKAAPGWLPFAPGASYWVPPVPQGFSEADVFDRYQNPLTKEEQLARRTGRGWPSSSYFVDVHFSKKACQGFTNYIASLRLYTLCFKLDYCRAMDIGNVCFADHNFMSLELAGTGNGFCYNSFTLECHIIY